MAAVVLSTKGQIAIPKAIRDQLKLKPGTKLTIQVVGSRITIDHPGSLNTDWRLLQGSLKDLAGLPSSQEVHAEARREELEIDEQKLSRF